MTFFFTTGEDRECESSLGFVLQSPLFIDFPDHRKQKPKTLENKYEIL